MVTVLSWLPCLPAAIAYEADQLSYRFETLGDSRAVADSLADRMLAEAIDATNESTRCQGDESEIRRVLAGEIHERFGKAAVVPARGQLPAMSLGAYAATLEGGPVARRTFEERDDIYSKVEWWQNILLNAVGPASTVRLGDVLLGTDKIDHFWVQGYGYFRESRWGQDEERAVRWGTFTERSYWGRVTTDVFSFADLAANYDGYSFYAGLLAPGSALRLDGNGCVEQVRPWDWSEWVDWRYDEVLNPCAYDPEVLLALREHLEEHREEICRGLDEERARDLAAGVAMAIRESLPYVLGRVPERIDPFRLDDLCFPGDVEQEIVSPLRRKSRRARNRAA